MKKIKLIASITEVKPEIKIQSQKDKQIYLCEFAPMVSRMMHKIVMLGDTVLLVGKIEEGNILKVESVQKIISDHGDTK